MWTDYPTCGSYQMALEQELSGPVVTCPTKGRTNSGTTGRELGFKSNSSFAAKGLIGVVLS